ncbi:MAG: YfiR family protein [Gammaproteobacteria bacterium]
MAPAVCTWLRVAAALVALAWPTVGRAQAAEYEAKAAFIYNIALFTSFPSASFANGDAATLRLCLLGRDPFDGLLQALQGKPVGGARLAVERVVSALDAIRRCQILFIGESEADSLAALAEASREAAVLTIADFKGAARRGVMLELSVQDKRIAFEFNGAAARAANISLSSKVLRLAKAVY